MKIGAVGCLKMLESIGINLEKEVGSNVIFIFLSHNFMNIQIYILYKLNLGIGSYGSQENS
jgi:hypothetical protein